MLEKIEGFVIDIVRHNDRHNVVSLYTRSRGRMSFLVPVGKSRQGKSRNAIITMMACLAADVNIRAGKELYHLGSPTPLRLWPGVYFNPVKTSILFFITEFCNRLLRQSPPDPLLWDYIFESMDTLEKTSAGRIANFHIAFLVRLLPFLGISPSTERPDSDFLFDMLSGSMIDPGRPAGTQRRILLPPNESAFIPLLERINFANMHRFRLSSAERRDILDGILRYYSLHLPVGTNLKSLEVLRDMH